MNSRDKSISLSLSFLEAMNLLMILMEHGKHSLAVDLKASILAWGEDAENALAKVNPTMAIWRKP